MAPAPASPASAPTNLQATEAFMGRVLTDFAGMFTSLFCAVGDRHGLFKDLAERGPATSAELAARTGLQERYLREWASGLTVAGYLKYEPATRRFALPPDHAPVLAQEGGPFFVGGAFQETLGALGAVDAVGRAFREGGGVAQDQYPPTFYEGLERFTNGWHLNHLVQEWIPSSKGIQAKLQQGCTVADVGCGAGTALVQLAKAFPKSRFVGYDVHAPSIARAEAKAREAGVQDRVRFEARDVAKQGVPEKFDVITTFDVVHDSVDPEGLLRAIRQGLKPGGSYLNLEINAAERLEDAQAPLGQLFYGFSLFYCMTVSLAHGGAGLGTVGMPESVVGALCAKAGFAGVERLPMESPFNVLYEARA